MANRFLVAGGDGNWNNNNNWAATSGAASGASFPVAGDVVAFDSLSGNANMTVNVASACASLVMSGTYAGTLTFNSTLTLTSTCTFVAACTIAGTAGTLILGGSATITSGGKTLTCALTFSTNTPTYTLADNWTVAGLVTLSGSVGSTLNGSSFKLTCQAGLTQGAGTYTGNSKFELTGGTWQSSGGSLRTNVDLAGNATISGTVAYGVGTLRYVSGTITTTGSTLSLLVGCTLDTAGVTWAGVSFAAASASFALTSALAWSGTLSIAQTTTLTGATLNGTGPMTVTNAITVTLSNTGGITTSGLVTVGAPAQTQTFNGNNVTCNGGCTNIAFVTGTAKFVMGGGTWQTTGTQPIGSDLDLAGNVTIGSSVYWGASGKILKYVSGTITVAGTVLNLPAACTLDTAGMTWAGVACSFAGTYTLNSVLAWSGTLAISASATYAGSFALNGTGAVTLTNAITVTLNNTGGLTTTGTLTLPNAAATIAGSAGFTVGTLTTASLSASRIHTLTFGRTYVVTTAISNVGTTSAIRQAIISSSPGNKVVLRLNTGGTADLLYCDPTDVDSSSGKEILTVRGTITTSTNWVTQATVGAAASFRSSIIRGVT